MSVSNPRLIGALLQAQSLGFLGDRPIAEVIDHAVGFAEALDGLLPLVPHDGPRVVDLGSGGGVPGLVIAVARPDVTLTLVDRRAKRMDFVRRIVGRLGLEDRVEVVCAEVSDFARRRSGAFDAAVARGFGPPATTLTLARPLVRVGGRIVVSEPPAGDRWDAELLTTLELNHEERIGPHRRFAVFEVGPPRFT